MTDFFSMGGYGAYIWSAYALALLVLLFNWVAPAIKRRQLINQLADRLKRQERRS